MQSLFSDIFSFYFEHLSFVLSASWIEQCTKRSFPLKQREKGEMPSCSCILIKCQQFFPIRGSRSFIFLSAFASIEWAHLPLNSLHTLHAFNGAVYQICDERTTSRPWCQAARRQLAPVTLMPQQTNKKKCVSARNSQLAPDGLSHWRGRRPTLAAFQLWGE